MIIKSVHIKNVRGLENRKILLDMIPNKPSVLIAPNGSGKSSFASAFQWLGKYKMKILNEKDAFNDNIENLPEMEIITDESVNNVYVANDKKNDIVKKFGIFVINNGLKASSPGYHSGIQLGKSRIVVPDIELLRSQPANKTIVDDFEGAYMLDSMPSGLFPVITSLLGNNSFLANLDIDQLKIGKRDINKIDAFIERVKSYKGTIAVRHHTIGEVDLQQLQSIASLTYLMKSIKVLIPRDDAVKCLLKSIRLITLYTRKKSDFKARIDYARYKVEEASVRALFDTIKTTWKDIKPKLKDGRLLLSIGDAQRISNGERDILILIGMLQRAFSAFTKEHNILVIDEVFDYMDDANLIAAQHYVNRFIADLKSKGKNIYPIILSHINPSYYRTFAFQDMKVYYLLPLQYPHASDNMMKLVRRRDELEKTDKDKANLISKYMLHYHDDYSQPMTEIIQIDDPNWGHVPTFKAYCKRQLDIYLSNNSVSYDALAVCVELREIIEKYCYDKLSSEEQKDVFLNGKNGTEAKLDYAEEQGVVCPETFSLLGLVYNDSLHPNNKNKIDLRQTLYSRLENQTIRGIVDEIKNYTEANDSSVSERPDIQS